MAIKINGITVAGKGAKGDNGENGVDGKSAYQYAVDGGYTGTEEEFTELVGSLDDLKNSVSNGKSLVASAITDKGVETSATAEFSTMATNISALGNPPVVTEQLGYPSNKTINRIANESIGAYGTSYGSEIIDWVNKKVYTVVETQKYVRDGVTFTSDGKSVTSAQFSNTGYPYHVVI